MQDDQHVERPDRQEWWDKLDAVAAAPEHHTATIRAGVTWRDHVQPQRKHDEALISTSMPSTPRQVVHKNP